MLEKKIKNFHFYYYCNISYQPISDFYGLKHLYLSNKSNAITNIQKLRKNEITRKQRLRINEITRKKRLRRNEITRKQRLRRNLKIAKIN